MIKKIIHIADLHIPNDCSQRPYYEMLVSFMKKLYANEIHNSNPSETRIVIVGDIFHNKIRASNEARSMFHSTLNYLNGFCKTYIVAGNHDMLENNRDRTDSLAPTFAIEKVYPNVVYLDRELGYKSGCVVDDNVVFALYSMHDSFAAPDLSKDEYKGKRIVGLYHGDVVGAVTDVGRACPDGIDTRQFSACDCVMAGHIHKFQEIERDGTRIVYAGSTFQQDAGENISGHGYVTWNMEDMSYTHTDVENDYRIFKFKIGAYDAFDNDMEKLVNR